MYFRPDSPPFTPLPPSPHPSPHSIQAAFLFVSTTYRLSLKHHEEGPKNMDSKNKNKTIEAQERRGHPRGQPHHSPHPSPLLDISAMFKNRLPPLRDVKKMCPDQLVRALHARCPPAPRKARGSEASSLFFFSFFFLYACLCITLGGSSAASHSCFKKTVESDSSSTVWSPTTSCRRGGSR